MRRIERVSPCPSGKTLAFTGHRPDKYPCLGDEVSLGYRAVRDSLLSHVNRAISEGFTHFVCGGALGVDTMAATLVLELKKRAPGITLEIAVPCERQHKYWREQDRREYERLLAMADVVTWISDAYTPFCMIERNRYMVDMCSRLIAVFDGTRGGTYNTVKYALDKGVETVVTDPRKLIV